MNLMSGRISLLLAIAALGLVSPAPIRALQLDASGLERVPMPSALHMVAGPASADFDGDGVPEHLILTWGRASLESEGRVRWQSPDAWQVRQTLITDLNHDGLPEAALLVWRPFKPWPVDAWLPDGGRISSFHDSSGLSCHIILIGWKRGAFRELWAGSAMADPIKRFAAADLSGNGRQYLVTLEGKYDDPPAAPSLRLKVWEWNGFGFTVVKVLEDSFSFMATAQTADRQVLILTP